MAEGSCTISAANEELYYVRHKWKRMGRQFHIPRGDLESFQRERDDEERLAMVVDWLERNGRLEWEEICRVLETRSVGEPRLASEIRENFCHIPPPGSMCYLMGIFVVLLAVVMPMLGGRCCPPDLDSEDYIALQKIKEEAENVEKAFLTMLIELRQALDESSTNVDDIVTTLRGLRVHSHFELPKFLQERLPQEKFDNVETIAKLFSILADVDPPLWDIHNYHLLEAIANIHLYNKNHSFIADGILLTYKSKLEEFENKTSFCLYSYFRKHIHFTPSTHSELLDIELDRPCKNYSIRESEWTRTQFFNRNLGIPEYSTYFLGATGGSVHQWWIVPKSIIPLLRKEVTKMRPFCKKYGIAAIRINDVNILKHAKKTYFRSLLQNTKYSSAGGSIINTEFNIVIPVAIGLLSLKLIPIPYIMYFSTLAIRLFYGSVLWNMPPVDTTQESAVTNSLASYLMQWVAMVIFSAYVCRWSLNQLTTSALIHTLNRRWFAILSFCISVSSLGSSPFEFMAHDWGILFYFLSAQTMNIVRTAMQATLLFHTNTSSHMVNRPIERVWLLSIPILAQHLGMYGHSMWNLSTSTDTILQLCLIVKDRFRPLDVSFAYALPAYLLVIMPSQQLYFSSTLQEGQSNGFHSNEEIMKHLTALFFLELNSIIIFSKLHSAKPLNRCEWARLSCNRWFIVISALISTISSLFLTLVLWGKVDESFHDDSISRSITAIYIKSLLALTAVTRLLRQSMEGLLFIAAKVGRNFGRCNPRLMCHGLFFSIILLIHTFITMPMFIHQTNLNWFVTFLALIMDICFHIALSSCVVRNPNYSAIVNLFVRQYGKRHRLVLWKLRSFLKTYIVVTIKVFVVTLSICFHCIGLVDSFTVNVLSFVRNFVHFTAVLVQTILMFVVGAIRLVSFCVSLVLTMFVGVWQNYIFNGLALPLVEVVQATPAYQETQGHHDIHSEVVFPPYRKVVFPPYHDVVFPPYHGVVFPSYHGVVQFPSLYEVVFPSYHQVVLPSYHQVVLPSCLGYNQYNRDHDVPAIAISESESVTQNEHSFAAALSFFPSPSIHSAALSEHEPPSRQEERELTLHSSHCTFEISPLPESMLPHLSSHPSHDSPPLPLPVRQGEAIVAPSPPSTKLCGQQSEMVVSVRDHQI